MSEERESRDEPWARLARAHQESTAEREAAMPYGFAVQVAARWREIRRNEVFAAWERLSLRAALASSLVAVIVACVSLQSEPAGAEEDDWGVMTDSGGAEPEFFLP